MSLGLVIGLGLALASTIALDLAFLLQQNAAANAHTLSLRAPLRALRALIGAKRWVAGFVLGLGGWAVYFAALTLAPISLVQTVAAAGITLLVLIQSLSARRLPIGRERTGALIATAGLAALALSLGGAAGAGGGANPTVFAILGLALAPVVLAAAQRGAGANGLAAGLCYGLGDIATKTLLAQLPAHPTTSAVAHAPFLYLTAGAHAAGFLLVQRAFQRGPAVASIGAMTAATSLLPIAAGVLLLGDPLPSSPLAVGLRVGAFVCAVAGAFLLATTREPLQAASSAAPRRHDQRRQASLAPISSS